MLLKSAVMHEPTTSENRQLKSYIRRKHNRGYPSDLLDNNLSEVNLAPPGGGTPLLGLYGDVPLDRLWFFGLAVSLS